MMKRLYACLNADKFLTNLGADLDFDNYLIHRESGGFDEAWMVAYREFGRGRGAPDDLTKLAYKRTLSITGSTELAAYVAHDFDLIFKDKNLNDTFCECMFAAYAAGKIPMTEALKND